MRGRGSAVSGLLRSGFTPRTLMEAFRRCWRRHGYVRPSTTVQQSRPSSAAAHGTHGWLVWGITRHHKLDISWAEQELAQQLREQPAPRRTMVKSGARMMLKRGSHNALDMARVRSSHGIYSLDMMLACAQAGWTGRALSDWRRVT